MVTQPSNVALIFAGGTGSRMNGTAVPKQFLTLAGKPIIIHTLKVFEDCPSIDGIMVVCVGDWLDHCRRLIERFQLKKVLDVVPGGGSGQESIFNGLSALDRDQDLADDAVVLVHDGVRPLVDSETIEKCLTSVRELGPTATVTPSTETVIEVRDGIVVDVLDRSLCYHARAPQGFLFKELLEAHHRARSEGRDDFVDSISMMSAYGKKIHVVEGPVDNIKITTQRDFFTFKSSVDMKEIEQLWQ